MLLKWLLVHYICAFLQDLKCLHWCERWGWRSPQQHPGNGPVSWMRRSITPPDLTASSELDAAVVSSSSVSPEPARASRKRPKDIENVILVKFVLLVFVHTTSVNETRVSEASKASSNNFMKNLKVRLHWLILYEQKPAGQTWPTSSFVLKKKNHKDWTALGK